MPVPVPSELNKYKLEQIDKKIKDIEKLQKEINDSINSYQKQIKGIDTKISNIKIERSQINNYYTIKEEEIKNADRKKIDSLLRKRYNF
jgi:septal ring factor EnvC (AmiA/AmiB activator)